MEWVGFALDRILNRGYWPTLRGYDALNSRGLLDVDSCKLSLNSTTGTEYFLKSMSTFGWKFILVSENLVGLTSFSAFRVPYDASE